eukprot:5329536-Pleurochrysis_carterae.AAC.1
MVAVPLSALTRTDSCSSARSVRCLPHARTGSRAHAKKGFRGGGEGGVEAREAVLGEVARVCALGEVVIAVE